MHPLLNIITNTMLSQLTLLILFIIYWELHIRDPDTFYDRLQFHRMFVLPITTKKQVCGSCSRIGIHYTALEIITKF